MIRFLVTIPVGVVYVYLAMTIWSVYGSNNAVNAWLIEVLASEGYPTVYALARIIHQVVVNALIAIPFVVLLILLRNRNGLGCIAAFSLAAVLVAFWSVSWSVAQLEDPRLWLDAAVLAVSPSLALLGIRALRS